jgi:hypothetical protein
MALEVFGSSKATTAMHACSRLCAHAQTTGVRGRRAVCGRGGLRVHICVMYVRVGGVGGEDRSTWSRGEDGDRIGGDARLQLSDSY